jgi:hypothetical protein
MVSGASDGAWRWLKQRSGGRWLTGEENGGR